MLRTYRPLARVIEFSTKPFPRPRSIGVTGVVVGFGVLILIGTFLLSLPQSRAPGQELDILGSFFTATSAVCVTGLVVHDTTTYWSSFGQGVILGLVQVGGLGVITSAMFILILLNRPVSLKDTFELHEMSRQGAVKSVGALLWLTIAITFLVEALGAIALWPHFLGPLGEGESLWYGVFHSVAAFNNAGFDLMGNMRV
jgi:trk system potassium uptake protein TrkH